MVPNERGEPQISPLFAGSEQLRSQQEKKSGGGGGGVCCGLRPPFQHCQSLGYVNRALMSPAQGGHPG